MVEANQIQEQAEKEKTSLMFNLPVAMKAELEKKAEAQQMPTAAFVRKIVADAIGFELPATAVTRAKKYATPEERAAAQKARDKSRRELIKSLLRQYREEMAHEE